MTILKRLQGQGLKGLATFSARVATVAVRNPAEALDHLKTQVALTRAAAVHPLPLTTSAEWRRELHERIGAPWPCPERERFARLWEELRTEEAQVRVGEAHDGDPTLAEAVWCLVRHLQPETVVETGVSRGVTSRMILEALEANGSGRLLSIDLPPLEEPWRQLVGSAVPERLRHRWSYIRGTSRRHLARVARDAAPIDLFVHDSLHTPENLRFEVETVRPFLSTRAAIVIDDAEMCRAGEAIASFAPDGLLAARDALKSDSVAFILR